MNPNYIRDDPHGYEIGFDETNIQYFSDRSGDTGYLREAYHGGPYFTEAFIPEAYAAQGDEVYIPAAVLRSRLRDARKTIKQRYTTIYGYAPRSADVRKAQDSVTEFVKLAEALEAAGAEPKIAVSY